MTPDHPQLTVIMPIHNERKTLQEVLARVLAVPIEKEIILVDDCSTDGTREMIKSEIEGKNPNVRVQYLAKKIGRAHV